MWFQISYNCLDYSCHLWTHSALHHEASAQKSVISYSFKPQEHFWAFPDCMLNSGRETCNAPRQKTMSHQLSSFTCFHHKEPFYASLMASHCSNIATPHCFWHCRWRDFFFFFLKIFGTCGVSLFSLAMADDTEKSFEVGKVLSHRHKSCLKGDDTQGLSEPWEMGVIPPSERRTEFTSRSWANLSETGCIVLFNMSTSGDCNTGMKQVLYHCGHTSFDKCILIKRYTTSNRLIWLKLITKVHSWPWKQ